MRNMKFSRLSIFVILITFLVGCKKKSADDQIELGGIDVVSPYQVVVVEAGKSLLKEQYEGVVANITVPVFRISDDTFMFIVPETVPHRQLLKFEIKEISYVNELYVEQASVGFGRDELVNYMVDYMESEISSVALGSQGKEEAENILEAFKANYANMTETEKNALARFIDANASFFIGGHIPFVDRGDVLSTTSGFSRSQPITDIYKYASNHPRTKSGVLPNEDLVKFSAAVLGMGVGVALVVGGGLPGAILGLLVIYKSYTFAVKYFDSFQQTKLYKSFEPFFEPKLKSMPAQSNTVPVHFVNNQKGELKLQVYARTLKEEDQTSTNPSLSIFFTAYQQLKQKIASYNEKVEWVKNRTFFTSLNVMKNVDLSFYDESVNGPTLEDFNRMTFSIDDKNIVMSGVALDNGQIAMTLKAMDADKTSAINTVIKVTYQDEFNQRITDIPVVLNMSSEFNLSGTWLLHYSALSDFSDGGGVYEKDAIDFKTDTGGKGTGGIGDIILSYNDNKLVFTIKDKNETSSITFPVTDAHALVFQTTTSMPVSGGGTKQVYVRLVRK